MKSVAIVQARMGSTRLPGKILLPLGKDCSLGYVTTRLKEVDGLQSVLVATTVDQSDDIVENFCKQRDVDCFRGDSEDVLSRYYHAAKLADADIIVRITSDCPFCDPKLVDEMLLTFKKLNNIDYLSNGIKRTFPRGLDVEIFSFQALEKAYKNAAQKFEREHVTPYIYQSGEFSIENYSNEVDFSHYRWTLDTFEDYSLLNEIAKRFSTAIFSFKDILSCLDKEPHLSSINGHIQQKSLKEV